MYGVSEPVPRVLGDLERASAQCVLPCFKRHLASLGIHGLAEQLRWEAYLSLAMARDHLPGDVVTGGSSMLQNANVLPALVCSRSAVGELRICSH